MPAVLSKPMYFVSRHYGDARLRTHFNNLPEEQGNFHFWVEQGRHIIDPTYCQPHELSKQKVYIPFPEEQQKQLKQRLLDSWCKENNLPEYKWEEHLDWLWSQNNYTENLQCFRNASTVHHKTPNSKLVCGMFGHKLPKMNIIDIDFGY